MASESLVTEKFTNVTLSHNCWRSLQQVAQSCRSGCPHLTGLGKGCPSSIHNRPRARTGANSIQVGRFWIQRILVAESRTDIPVKEVPMRTVDGLHALLVSAILCGMVQTAAGQSSDKAEVLAAHAERDKAFVAGDETKMAQ